MTRIAFVLATVLLATGVATLAAQPAKRAETLFAEAQHKDVAEGDLKAAISLYQQVVAQAGSNRALAARALLASGDAYRKLGDSQAQRIFEDVLLKYPDQAAPSSAARARLGRTSLAAASQALTTQRVLASGDRISPDGRYFVRTEANLELYELSTGTVRVVTNDGNDGKEDEANHRYPLDAVFAPDGQRLAYTLYIEKENRSILRVVSIAGERSDSTTLYDNAEVTDITPMDWPSDGRWIAVSVGRRDLTRQVGLVRVDDGSLHGLRSVEWMGASHMAFSPDSRYLAYDRPAAEGETERDVFVIAVNATRELPAVVNPGDDRIVGWARDGSRLLFASDRGGTVGLWALVMRDGQPISDAEFLSDFGMARPIGITSSGTLYYKVLQGGADIWVAPLDRQSGQLSSTPTRLVRQFKGLNQMPEWSADGQYLAYVSKRDPSPVTIVVSSATTGDVVRELHPKVSYLLYPRWSPDGRTFIARGSDIKGRSGIVRVDTVTGAASLVVPNETCSGVPYWAAQGRTFYCYKFSEQRVVEIDVDSGTVKRSFSASQGNASPDGRYLVFSAGGGLSLLALADGTSREILRSTSDTRLGNLLTLTFTPDSQHVVFGGRVRGVQGIWRIPIAGGEPERIAVEAPSITQWRFNPKTWQVAFAPSNAPSFEIRKMENYLPGAKPVPRR